MRKTQIKIIKKAEKYKFDTEYVDVLSNLNCKISDIEYIYDYINYCRKHQKKEDIIEEVKKYACSEYMNLYLYWIPKEGDPLIGCSNKKKFLYDMPVEQHKFMKINIRCYIIIIEY